MLLQVDAAHQPTLFNLALLLEELGRYPEAVVHVTTALTHSPDYVKGRILLGSLYNKLSQVDRALLVRLIYGLQGT